MHNHYLSHIVAWHRLIRVEGTHGRICTHHPFTVPPLVTLNDHVLLEDRHILQALAALAAFPAPVGAREWDEREQQARSTYCMHMHLACAHDALLLIDEPPDLEQLEIALAHARAAVRVAHRSSLDLTATDAEQAHLFSACLHLENSCNVIAAHHHIVVPQTTTTPHVQYLHGLVRSNTQATHWALPYSVMDPPPPGRDGHTTCYDLWLQPGSPELAEYRRLSARGAWPPPLVLDQAAQRVALAPPRRAASPTCSPTSPSVTCSRSRSRSPPRQHAHSSASSPPSGDR